MGKINLKLLWNYKEAWVAKTILEKKKDLKTHSP